MIDQHWLHHTVEEPLRIWTCFSEEEGWEPSERVWTTEGYEGLPPSEGGGRVQAQDSIYLSHGTVSVLENTLWFDERSGDLPASDESTVCW